MKLSKAQQARNIFFKKMKEKTSLIDTVNFWEERRNIKK